MSRLLIQFSHLFKSFGSLPLFEEISFSVNQGDILALVGENGSGKTTLLRLLSGNVFPDTGHISRANNLTIGLLPQEIDFVDPNISVKSFLEEGKFTELERAMATLLEQPHGLAEWGKLHEEYELLGGYRQVPIEKVLKGLKLEKTLFELPMGALSSGQRVRIVLAKVLIGNPDLLLLDEPTNHLDSKMLGWLGNILRMRKGATILVSHDRKFINTICNRLIEIKNGKLTYYGRNYDYYLTEQNRLKESQMKAYEAQQEERSLLKQKIKAVTFSKKQAPPPSDRNIMAYDRRGGYHQKSLQRNLDVLQSRLAETEKNLLPHPMPKSITGLRFIPKPLLSSVAIELMHVTKAFEEEVLFSGLERVLSKGDRVILKGPNGVGKTTLLQCIAGILSVDTGSIRYAPTVKIAYLDQEVRLLPMNKTPSEYFESQFQMSKEDLMRELHKAAIGGEELLDRAFSSLSTGQRKRFMLLSMILERPNVLLLDEPTNHLDFLTLEALEKALMNFEGAILAASHDPVFIEKIATKQWSLKT